MANASFNHLLLEKLQSRELKLSPYLLVEESGRSVVKAEQSGDSQEEALAPALYLVAPVCSASIGSIHEQPVTVRNFFVSYA